MDRALGILEVRGMTALAAAVDAMAKAARVRLTGRHGIGSGWLTVVVEGATGDVQTAIAAGREHAAARGTVITAAVVPRPEPAALAPMPHGAARLTEASGFEALGILETKGVTPLIAGADAMAKAADVELRGWTYIGGALVHAFATGGVGDVETALAAGEATARRAGEFHDALVLPQPDPAVGSLFPPPAPAGTSRAGALGVVETTGYVGAVAASDAMVKEADVEVVRLTIGSGGRVAALVTGALDGVRAAVAAGAGRAGEATELNGQAVITGPDPSVLACFAQAAPAAPTRPRAGQAMGLVETRTTVGLVKALDEMLKNAEVVYEGRYKVGYFLTACVVRGETGAVDAALDVARRVAGRYGELVAAHAIPLPYDALELRLPHG